LTTPNGSLPLARGRGSEELPEATEDLVAEIMRRYPGLSRSLAEYLAR
jgi:hypothetical protein